MPRILPQAVRAGMTVSRLTGGCGAVYLLGSRRGRDADPPQVGKGRAVIAGAVVTGRDRRIAELAGGRGERENGSPRNPAASMAACAAVAQPVECVLGKDEVTGSIPVSSFVVRYARRHACHVLALGAGYKWVAAASVRRHSGKFGNPFFWEARR